MFVQINWKTADFFLRQARRKPFYNSINQREAADLILPLVRDVILHETINAESFIESSRLKPLLSK